MSENKIITDIDQVTTEWLTLVLSNSRALTSGNVISFKVDRGHGNWSVNAKLHIKYEDDAKGKLPKRLFLKIVSTDLDDEFFGSSEVTYYKRDYLGVTNAPLISCYDAEFSEEQHCYHLLLDDISQTHVEANIKDPTLSFGKVLAEGLAAMHAKWWGAERLTNAEVQIHGSKHIRHFVEIAEPGAGHIIDNFSNELKPHWPDKIRNLFANHPQAMIERTKDDNGFTLIHGDVGDTNIMVPHNGELPIYIIDRQPFDWSLTTWLGVYDLAYALVLDWDIESRRNHEISILRHYHQSLIRNGVSGYSWEQLYDDYRLSVVMGVYIATEYCRGGVNYKRQDIWLPYLLRSLTAYDDLKCSELWE